MVEAENNAILNRHIITISAHLVEIFCLKVLSLKTTFVNLPKIGF